MDTTLIILLTIGCGLSAVIGALGMRRVMRARLARRQVIGSYLVDLHHSGPCALCETIRRVELADEGRRKWLRS